MIFGQSACGNEEMSRAYYYTMDLAMSCASHGTVNAQNYAFYITNQRETYNSKNLLPENYHLGLNDES